MSLREINAIELGKDMYINYTMKNTYDLRPGDILVAEIRRHFDEKKRLKNEINEKVEIELQDDRWLTLDRDIPSLKKYDVQEEDYIEIVYTHLKRGGETIEIFPGEDKEYLDFDPDEE
jgi:hypothetical protein